MPPTPPQSLTAAHIVYALLPDEPSGAAVEPRQHYTLVQERLNGQLALAELWKNRIATLPTPPAPQSLQELVQAARRRLRSDRLRDDTEELEARRWVVLRVLEELAPGVYVRNWKPIPNKLACWCLPPWDTSTPAPSPTLKRMPLSWLPPMA
jgi:hypothetical protein